VTREGDYCETCHGEFELERDPLDTSHQELADQARFDTCLRCHDFHGNHLYAVPESLDEAFDLDAVQLYLEGGESPYGRDRRFEATPGRELEG